MTNLYTPFRCLGHVSDGSIAPAVLFKMGRSDAYVVTSVGRAFQIFDVSFILLNCPHTCVIAHGSHDLCFMSLTLLRLFSSSSSQTKKLHLKAVSDTQTRRISALAALGEATFAAVGSRILVWIRGKLVSRLEHSTGSKVHLLKLFGSYVISLCTSNVVNVWDTQAPWQSMTDPVTVAGAGSRILCVLHPSAYLNKLLFGCESGEVLLWNIKTSKLLHTFKGWGSPVNCMESSPALDVVAFGLGDGRIVLHNIKLDAIVMTLTHVRSSISSLSFRSDASAPYPTLVSGDSTGAVAVWDLDRRRMTFFMKKAHTPGGVASVALLSGEPVMVTSGTTDNALKMWIFDADDGSCRLLRERSGHCAPPRVLTFWDHDTLLSGGGDGSVRSISIIQDHRCKELSQKNVKKASRDQMKRLPAVLTLAHSPARQKDWNSVITVHSDMSQVCAWNMGKLAERFHVPPDDGSLARCAIVTHCGNFCFVGTAAGNIHCTNVQSGQWRAVARGAHKGSVEGLASDMMETVVVSCGLDGHVRFWSLQNNLAAIGDSINVGCPLTQMVMHREGGLVAFAADDWCVRVLDMESRSIVREFHGHSNQVTSLCFSGNCRWLLSASTDASLRTWDIVSSHCIDRFLCPSPVVAMAFSPLNDLLATAHLDNVGVFVWSNKGHFTEVYLKPVDESARVQLVPLPLLLADDRDSTWFTNPEESRRDEPQQAQQPSGPLGDHAWSWLQEQPLGLGTDGLVRVSGEPDSKFLSLVHVDQIKERNKAQQVASQVSRAPFSLPSMDVFIKSPTALLSKDKSHILSGQGPSRGPLSQVLCECVEKGGDWSALAQRFRVMSSAAIDAEVRLLSLEEEGREISLFCQFLMWLLEVRIDYDLYQGYLHCFLVAHSESIVLLPHLKLQLDRLQRAHKKIWSEMEQLLQRSICMCSLGTKITSF